MPKYLTLFSFNAEALQSMIANPTDRKAILARLTESLGGRLEAYYWMDGAYDGMAISELPDVQTTVALGTVIKATGVFSSIEWHALMEWADVQQCLAKAKDLQSAYQPIRS